MVRNFLVFGFLVFCSAVFLRCSSSYRDISSANGRQAVIDQANNFLTTGNCDEAITVLKPLYSSQYVDNEIRMIMASAYMCKGGYSFPKTVGALQKISGNDIWSPLVLSNYSTSLADGKIGNFKTAAGMIRATSSITDNTRLDYFGGAYRSPDANFLMVFTQLDLIGVTISAIGGASPSLGTKAFPITGLGSVNEHCTIGTALMTVLDSLNYVSTGTQVDTVAAKINIICAAIPGGCAGSLDPAQCTAGSSTENLGIAAIVQIDAQWQ